MKNKAERVKKRRRRVRDNVQIVVLLVLALFFLTLCRYGWVQIVKGSEMSERVRMQSGEERVAQSPRGAILDANGRELAVSSMTQSLFVDPSHVGDAAQLAADLAPIVGLSEADILEDIDQGGGFVWVKRRMEPYMSDAVKALIREKSYGDCLGFRDEAKRYYPNDVLAANVLGFVGTDDKGLDGIEQQFDGLIKGVEEENFILTDMKSRPILSSLFMPDTYTGDRCKTVTLTIDSNIQFIVEQELDRAMAENAPQHATAIVMDPKTGNILALAMRPSYNPNEFGKYSSETWKNLAVSSIYEPGSTFKSVVAGAALEEKIVTPNQIFVDPGYVMVSGRRIQNWNGESFGTVTFTDVVKNSLNTGFALVGLDLGAERLTKYAKLFGFGEPTGVELPAEEGGILFDPENMRDSDMATMAIGQSIAVTPLQLAAAMAAIANGITLHGGLRSYIGTFFVFSDYIKPMARLASLMRIPVTYVLTHDSIGVGEDGHTASIFPDRLDLFETKDIVAVTRHPVTGQGRVTLTGSTINNCYEVTVLCTGEKKRRILDKVLRWNNPEYPISHVKLLLFASVIFKLDLAASRYSL